MTTDPYPEHAKQEKVIDEAQIIGRFLDTTDYVLAEYHENGGGEDLLWPVTKTIQQILADYFDIDLNKIETEKQQMLDAYAERGLRVRPATTP